MSNEKQLTKEKEETNLPVFLNNGNNGPTGFEETCSDSFKTPFIKILQTLSPELNPKKPEYIPEAKIGQFCNTVTKQTYDEINVVIVKIEHNLLVWKPNRGGFVGAYNKHDELKIVKKIEDGIKKKDADGNNINDTLSFFMLNIDNPSDVFILSLATTSLKYAKNFNSKLKMLSYNGTVIGKSYAGVWNITTVEDSNEKGSWNTIGNTAKFKRFITDEEFSNFVKPALEMISKSEVDYNQIAETNNEPQFNEEEVQY